eukprot:365643-Chlamydomonas_euryale.AAC.13
MTRLDDRCAPEPLTCASINNKTTTKQQHRLHLVEHHCTSNAAIRGQRQVIEFVREAAVQRQRLAVPDHITTAPPGGWRRQPMGQAGESGKLLARVVGKHQVVVVSGCPRPSMHGRDSRGAVQLSCALTEQKG